MSALTSRSALRSHGAMPYRTVVLALVLSSCTPTPHTATVVAKMQLAACSTATPDDGSDDTVAIQAAIASRCCLGPGTYDIDTPAVTDARRRYNMLTVGPGQELCGAGQATVLRFRGDAGKQDWRGIEVTGGLVHGLTAHSGDLMGTVEQTHLIHVTGPADGIRLYDLWLDHPIRGTEPGGDAVDIVGYSPASLVTDLVIRDVQFTRCDRACIQVHSGTVGLRVDHVEMWDTGDVDINSEGSGGNKDWTLTRIRTHASKSNQGAFSVALDLVDGVTLSDSHLERGVYAYACTGCVITRNTIEALSGHSQNAAVIELTKASNETVLVSNTIRRSATQDAGPVIHIGPHGTQQPKAYWIVDNAITQETSSDLVYVEGADGVTIAGNTLVYAGPATTTAAGVRLQGSGGTYGTPVSHVDVSGNKFGGQMAYAIAVAGQTNRAPIGSLNATWNTSEYRGLWCLNLLSITGPIVQAYNAWVGWSCGVPSMATTIP